MRKIRRNNHEARIELMPLIDVVFLLITFFIYSLIVMVHIDVKKVNFSELDAGVRARAEKIKPITLLVDRLGIDYTDSSMLIACAADVHACLAINPSCVMRVMVPKSLLSL